MELDERELKRLKELLHYKVLSPTPDEICDEIERLHSIIKEVREYINHYETIRGYFEYEELGYDEYNYDEDLKQGLLEILDKDNDKE